MSVRGRLIAVASLGLLLVAHSSAAAVRRPQMIPVRLVISTGSGARVTYSLKECVVDVAARAPAVSVLQAAKYVGCVSSYRLGSPVSCLAWPETRMVGREVCEVRPATSWVPVTSDCECYAAWGRFVAGRHKRLELSYRPVGAG